MKFNRIFLIFFLSFFQFSCADYNIQKNNKKNNKVYYSSKGFALIYENNLYDKKIVNKRLDNKNIEVLHSILKTNTPIKIINPINQKTIETKVSRKALYPKIFNIVITNEISSILGLDIDNPYVEVLEIKKNKKFVAKEGSIFEVEKNVAGKAPVDDIQMDDLTINKKKVNNVQNSKKSFILVISDFYYENSAIILKDELVKKTQNNNISVKKINKNKYRLYVGPFKNFNALKTTYISLNNLGFEDLNVYRN